MEISKTKLTVTDNNKSQSGKWASWCKKWVNSTVEQIVRWKIKINHIQLYDDESLSMWISIVSKKTQNGQEIFATYYEISNDRSTIIYDTPNCKGSAFRNGIEFVTGDILSIILDTKKRTIGVKKNNEEIYIVFEKINTDATIQFKLIIGPHFPENSVSLIDYSSDLILS